MGIDKIKQHIARLEKVIADKNSSENAVEVATRELPKWYIRLTRELEG